jgi:GNAT superfamily N-acetyltransferase
MLFSNLELARRLERTEGLACAQFSEARRRLFPESGAGWMECGGAWAVFDGTDSPLTQTFGLGLSGGLDPALLDRVERFFIDRGAPIMHEVSPLAGVAALDLLCLRGYRPIEISSVLVRKVEPPASECPEGIRVRVTGREESRLWAEVSARGWSHDHPELHSFLLELGAISTAREQGLCFLAEFDAQAGAAGVLCIHEGVALFAGATTVPEFRRRGLQGALLAERMRYAFEHGCDLAMMVAQAGSESQRNAERKGFQVAYTRIKWQLLKAGASGSR